MGYPTLWRSRTPSLWTELDSVFTRPFGADITSAWTPAVDVRETGDELVLTAELPGLESTNVSVNVENNVLTISGEKTEELATGGDDAQFHVIERRYGRFERSFRLPRSVDAEKVDARFKGGLLTVSIPKVEAAKPRKIDVKVT